MNLFARKKLLGGLIGLVAAGALLAPVAAAPAPAPVEVAASSASSVSAFSLATDPPSTCTITVDVTWDASALNGPSVNLHLLESFNGGPLQPAGTLMRTANDGSQQFAKYNRPAGEYAYQVLVTKGPKHVIASGASATVVCTP